MYQYIINMKVPFCVTYPKKVRPEDVKSALIDETIWKNFNRFFNVKEVIIKDEPKHDTAQTREKPR